MPYREPPRSALPVDVVDMSVVRAFRVQQGICRLVLRVYRVITLLLVLVIGANMYLILYPPPARSRHWFLSEWIDATIFIAGLALSIHGMRKARSRERGNREEFDRWLEVRGAVYIETGEHGFEMVLPQPPKNEA